MVLFDRICRLGTAELSNYRWILGCEFEGKLNMNFCYFIVVIDTSNIYRGTASII
jgi:hypothetical protein